MQEHQVTAGGHRHPLPEPFFVLATQNPIEQEGTYPLPEAQLDRFMFMMRVDYPAADEEFKIVQTTTAATQIAVTQVLSGERDPRAAGDRPPRAGRRPRPQVRARVRPRDARDDSPTRAPFVKQWVSWGAGPRASQYLVLAGKARAVLARPHLRRRARTSAPSRSPSCATASSPTSPPRPRA